MNSSKDQFGGGKKVGLPPYMILFGIEPARLDTGLEMSPAAAAEVETLTEMVARELAGLGFVLAPRPDGEAAASPFPAAESNSPAANLP